MTGASKDKMALFTFVSTIVEYIVVYIIDLSSINSPCAFGLYFMRNSIPIPAFLMVDCIIATAIWASVGE